MKIKELKNATQRELNSLSEADLRSAFSNVKRSYSARAKSFEKLGVKQTIPQKVLNAINSDNPSRTQLLNALLSARSNFSSSLSTARGKQAFEASRKNALKDRLGLSDLSDAQFDMYGKFMGEMQERYKEVWKQISFLAWKIATEAIQRNLDPSQFIENFEYWVDHMDDLEVDNIGDYMDAVAAGEELFDSETLEIIESDEPVKPKNQKPDKHRSSRKAAEARKTRSRKGRRR